MQQELLEGQERALFEGAFDRVIGARSGRRDARIGAALVCLRCSWWRGCCLTVPTIGVCSVDRGGHVPVGGVGQRDEKTVPLYWLS